MLLVEQVLLAGVAAALSVWLVTVLPPIVVARVPGMSEEILNGTGPDWRVLMYLGAVALLTAVGAGTAPALESMNVQLVESLKGRRALSGSRGISRTQGVLICTQVVLSMVPLVGTAAFLHAERQFDRPGFDADRVLVASVWRDAEGRPPLEWPIDRVEAIPAVRSTALAASVAPFTDDTIAVERPGRGPVEFPVKTVSPAYFRTLGISIVSGRPFRDDDALRDDGDRAAIVSLAFARRVFPGQDAVGKTFDVPAQRKLFAIVGVAADTLTFAERARFANDRSLIYEVVGGGSDASKRPRDHTLLVRFSGDASRFESALQAVVTPEPSMRVSVETLQSILDDSLGPLRLLRTLVMIAAGIGLALALVGVFGILAFAATQRRKEVAIRAAVGASRAEIFGAVIRPALRPTGLGIAIGAGVSFAVLRFFESVGGRWGSFSFDPLAYVAGAGLLLCAALAAMSSPAWRAATADPSRALRED
jgi:hypothetical protein